MSCVVATHLEEGYALFSSIRVLSVQLDGLSLEIDQFRNIIMSI